MATRIKLKRSTTALAVPTTSNLEDGEVALNIADKKVYVRDGSNIIEVANQAPNVGEVTTAMFGTDITNGPGQTYFVAKGGSDANTLGNTGANGKHPDTPFLTVAKALSVATSGDTVNVASGTYQEIFPLTVPDGVTLRGANLRSTQIAPTPGTNDLNAIILEGDSHVSDLTVKDFFYNSSNDTGYGFVCASNNNSDRSPYVERVTVLTKGSVTSGTDPYGFAQGDAGRGAKVDGSLFASGSIEAAVLFNECTFIVPNSVGLLGTNGVRIEWLNSFVYFAAEGIKGVQGTTGRSGSGQTRLKLGGVSGTFASTEVIYQLEDTFKSGTYSRTGTAVTITRAAHGITNGEYVYVDFISGTATDGYYPVSNATTNTFDITDTASGTTSGNVTYKKVDAYGTLASNDGTYVYINGKGTGQFTTTTPLGVGGTAGGDAQLDTAQKKFGTASVTLDGVGDQISFATNENYGFGTANWTLEAFIRPGSVSNDQYIFDLRTGSASDTAPTVYLSGTTLHFGVGNTSQISGGTLSINTWYHVAVARFNGTTRLFLDGVQLGQYSDANDYGTTKPVVIGGDYAGANYLTGHVDEVRVSKANGRYTGAFTAPTAAFSTDVNTVILLHLDGDIGTTTISNSGLNVKDVRSSGGDTATSIVTADYAQFGMELRSISSANVYGTKGAIADGAGVKLLLTAHNFAYIGSGKDFTNDPDLAIAANEVTELNGGRIFFSSTNEKGDFKVGDAFVVDQETGNVQFQASGGSQATTNITLSDGTGTTNVFPGFIETGNLRLSGNTLSSTSGQVIVDPSGDEDIKLNAEVIVPENLFLNNTKALAISGAGESGVAFKAGTDVQAGFSTYGLFSNKSLGINKKSLSTTNGITITNEGSGYDAGAYSVNLLSEPASKATATAVLATTGSVGTINVTNGGSLYIVTPAITGTSPVTGSTSYSGTLGDGGGVGVIAVSSGGSGYVSPTAQIDPPPLRTWDANTSINNNRIEFLQTIFKNDDQVIYDNNGNTDLPGLVNGNIYFVVNRDLTDDSLQLSATQGGAPISLSATASQEFHGIRGITATATVTVSAGAIASATVTNPGTGYSTTIPPTITLSETGSPDATFTITNGSELRTINASGDGLFNSPPQLTITPQNNDPVGSGAAATVANLTYTLASVTVNTAGYGYGKVPVISFTGGNPNIDAIASATLDIETGTISSIEVSGPGEGYDAVPTVNILGGSGSNASASIVILPVDGNITSAGSGYAPGTYQNVFLTGGTGTGAQATFTVPGLFGTITNAGSGYTDGTYQQIDLVNTPIQTIIVTVANRLKLDMSVSGITGTINVGDTADNGSGVTGTVTYVGSDFATVDPASVSGGSFAQGDVVTFTSGGSGTLQVTPISNYRYFFDGSEAANLTFIRGNTYRFDMSDSSNTNHPIDWDSTTSSDPLFERVRVGTEGTAGAFTDFIVKPTATTSTNTVFLTCTAHGRAMTEEGYVNITTGAVGQYGSGGQITVEVVSGVVNSVTWDQQGDGYKANDIVDVTSDGLIGSGSGFVYTINGNNTGVSSITDIQSTGSGYTVADTLGVDPLNLGGTGSGFAFTVTKVGFANSAVVTGGGDGFFTGQTLNIDITNLAQSLGSGTGLALEANQIDTTSAHTFSSDGSYTGEKISFSAGGTVTITDTSGSSSLSSTSLATANITASGNVGVGGDATVGGNITVSGTATVSNNFAANGANNTIDNAVIELQDGAESTPSLNFANDNTTGFYTDAVGNIKTTSNGSTVSTIDGTDLKAKINLFVDSNLTAPTPFFKVDPTAETVSIGDFQNQLQINNDASIQAVGNQTDIDIRLEPKGTGDVVVTGAAGRNLVVKNGATETIRMDSEAGSLVATGSVDVDQQLRLSQNVVSNIDSTATNSFGEIVEVSLTGTGSGYLDGSYTAVTSTTSGSGSGATFNVTVASGDITVCTVNTKGSNYSVGDTITLNASTIGSGTGRTVTVTDISGLGVVVKPSAGKSAWINTTGSLVIPAGTTNQRPVVADRIAGAIRFNSEQQQFEGYNGTDFVSLGGVRDVDQDTYILTETSPGSDEDTFEFYNAGFNSLSINKDKFTLKTARTIDVEGTLILNGTLTGQDPLDGRFSDASIFKIRAKKDIEVTGGLRFRAVPVQGGIATINSFTSVLAAYTPSTTITVASLAQFEGTGATFDVTTDGSGNITTIVVNNAGSGYEVGELITISGNLVGGVSPAEDVTFTVATISNSVPAFSRLEVLNNDYVSTLNSKAFISLDGNGSEAGWKINRGWNAGTTNYLTVFDSTGDFVELDDCRVDGGELSSFTTNQNFIQFDKTSFKGAKSLVTIESDDGKVHMLEITAVCAAGGTDAYATVTNSVTSDNDLVDASISVVGNNVQVTIAKSSSATSSTSFTGRFTTTKVKV